MILSADVVFTALLLGVLIVPVAVVYGLWIWRSRQRKHHGFPPSTDGGPHTVYRRRVAEESEGSSPA